MDGFPNPFWLKSPLNQFTVSFRFVVAPFIGMPPPKAKSKAPNVSFNASAMAAQLRQATLRHLGRVQGTGVKAKSKANASSKATSYFSLWKREGFRPPLPPLPSPPTKGGPVPPTSKAVAIAKIAALARSMVAKARAQSKAVRPKHALMPVPKSKAALVIRSVAKAKAQSKQLCLSVPKAQFQRLRAETKAKASLSSRGFAPSKQLCP